MFTAQNSKDFITKEGGKAYIINDISPHQPSHTTQIGEGDYFVFEDNCNWTFNNINEKAKFSSENSYSPSTLNKLFYMATVFTLKAALFFMLEDFYKKGYDFIDL